MIPLIVLMVVGQGMDIATTWMALHRGCGELNPLFHVAGFAGIVGAKVVVLSFVVWMAGRRSDGYRLVRYGVIFGFGAAAWNVLMMRLGC